MSASVMELHTVINPNNRISGLHQLYGVRVSVELCFFGTKSPIAIVPNNNGIYCSKISTLSPLPKTVVVNKHKNKCIQLTIVDVSLSIVDSVDTYNHLYLSFLTPACDFYR